MNPNCIEFNTRPNVHKLTKQELLEIIIYWDDSWYQNYHTRSDMVDKVFQLWSECELIDIDNHPIECFICWDKLTNGNNMTFGCGHKFHSTCIVKNVLIHSTDSYINYIGDDEKKSVKIDYNCPQCKKLIEFIEFNKNIIVSTV